MARDTTSNLGEGNGFPRANGAPGYSPPAHYPAAYGPPRAEIGSGERTASGFLEIVQRRWLLILMFALVGGGLGYLYQTQRTPMYQASARVHVDRKQPMNADIASVLAGGPTPTEQLLLTHMEIIRSPKVLEKAAEDPSLKALTTFSGQPDLVAVMLGGLAVGRPKSKDNVVIPNILEIVYRCEQADEARVILTAIVAAYKDYVQRQEASTTLAMTTLLEETRTKLQAEIAVDRKEYEKFLQELENDAPLPTDLVAPAAPTVTKGPLAEDLAPEKKAAAAPAKPAGESRKIRYIRSEKGDLLSLDQQFVVDLERKLRLLQQTREETEARLKRLKSLPLDSPEARSIIEVMAGRQMELSHTQLPELFTSTYEGQLFTLKMRETELLTRLGDEHPDVVNVRKMIAMTKQYDDERRAELQQRIKDRPKPPIKDLARSYVESLKLEVDINKDVETGMRKTVAQVQPTVQRFLQLEAKDKKHREAIASKQALFDVMVKRLEEIRLGLNEPGLTVDVIQRPSPAGEVTGLILRAVLAGAAVGFMLGFAVSYLAELADKCFRSPEEIRQTLGVQVLAHVPELSGDRKERKKGQTLHRTLASFYAPKSRAAEAFRSVRTGLYFSTRDEAHKAIQITSPEPSDGKTTLSSNLAISIAQSGKRVLLIDADMRRPKVHRLFGLQSNERGLVTVLGGSDSLDDALAEIPEVENLTLLPSGPPPSNPAEILTSEAFEALIERCKERFDYVLVDTPPVLAVTDPTVVAPRVDGVILAIRLDKNSRPKAVRAVETLSQINSKIIGIVVSGVGGSGDSGYGRYGYSGSYKYQAELLYGGANAYYDAYFGREEPRQLPKK